MTGADVTNTDVCDIVSGRQDWMNDAACRGMPTDLFFPQRGEPLNQIRAVCAGCRVAAECLEYALTNTDKFGVWGGKSEKERRKLRHTQPQPKPVEHGTNAHRVAHANAKANRATTAWLTTELAGLNPKVAS